MENKQFKEELKNHIGTDLDRLLEEIVVMPCEDMVDDFIEGSGMHILNTQLKKWFAVVNSQGIIAYFGEKSEAFRFRLDYINRIINN